jgi:hypothetical protein
VVARPARRRRIGDPILTVFNTLLRVFYRAETGALQHIWCDISGKWSWQPLPVKMAAAGDPVCTSYNDYLHMFYRESRGFIWHVYWVNGWSEEQLTGPGLSGGELAEGEPAATSFGSEIHVVYRDVNDNLSDAYWTGTTWDTPRAHLTAGSRARTRPYRATQAAPARGRFVSSPVGTSPDVPDRGVAPRVTPKCSRKMVLPKSCGPAVA